MKHNAILALVAFVVFACACTKDDKAPTTEVKAATATPAPVATPAAPAVGAADVTTNPAKYIEVQGFQWKKKGILHHSVEADAITLVNKSPVPVNELRAQVEFNDGSAFPVSFFGSLLPGDTKVFSQSANTLKSGGVEVKGPLSGAHLKWVNVGVPQK